MMTARELLRIAKNINPEKLETDPQAALEDAYLVWEAVRLAELEKISVPNYGQSRLAEPPDPREVEEPPRTLTEWRKRGRKGKKPNPLDDLQIWMKDKGLSVRSASEIAQELKVSTSTLYGWLRGKFKPTADSIAKIERFLTNAGYYQ